nr:hypothetical protein [Tanacetum cinerariifolium]
MFFIDEKEVTFSLNDLQTLFQLPQAINNNHAEFVTPPDLIVMLAFLNQLGYAKQIYLTGQFLTTYLPQPWKTLRKTLMRCLSTREMGVDQPPLHMMQMFYCIIYNVHVDYAALIWEGHYYSPVYPKTLIPYLRFIKKGTGNEDSIMVVNGGDEADEELQGVDEHLLDDDMEKIVEGDEESDANKLTVDMINSHKDPDTKIDHGSHKETLEVEEVVDYMSIDEAVEEESSEAALIRKKGKVSEVIKLEREKTKADIASMVANAIKDDKQARNDDLPLWIALMYKVERLASYVDPCRVDAFRSRDHEYHHDDDVRPEGESSAKRQRTFEKRTYTRGTNDDEVPFEELSQEILAEMTGNNANCILTIEDKKHKQNVPNDMTRSRCDSGEEHQCHLD